MANIKSVLKNASSYSDSGVPKGWPPTPQDVAMRAKHTAQSVEYNIFDHADDHIAEGIAQLGKLEQVDRHKAWELAEKICKIIDRWYAAVEPFKEAHERDKSGYQ